MAVPFPGALPPPLVGPPAAALRVLPAGASSSPPKQWELCSKYLQTSRKLEPKSPTDAKYLETSKKVDTIWERSVGVIENYSAARGIITKKNIQIDFSKCYISFKDENEIEHRFDMRTRLNNPAIDSVLQPLMEEISHTGKELASQFNRPQNNPEADFAVTSSSNWDAIRPRNHEEFRAKGQERALIQQINAHPAGPANAVLDARQRIANTDQFIKALANALQTKREGLETQLAEMMDPTHPNHKAERNHPHRVALQKKIENITQLETMLTSIDERGTRDAIYWAVGIGGEINDNDPDLANRLSQKADQISRYMSTALQRPLSPEDTRGRVRKRLGISKPPTYQLDDVNNSYLTAYAQDAGNLVYSGGSIENFVVHCATRVRSPGRNVGQALGALGISFERDAAGHSELEDELAVDIIDILDQIRDNPHELPPELE